jgi:hypothetical protein
MLFFFLSLKAPKVICLIAVVGVFGLLFEDGLFIGFCCILPRNRRRRLSVEAYTTPTHLQMK